MTLLIGLILLLLHHSTVNAQDLSSPTSPQATDTITQVSTDTPTPTPEQNPLLTLFTKLKDDFLFQRDYYEKMRVNYVNKVKIHTQYNNPGTQNDKLEATREVLKSRNNTLRTYLSALKTYLDFYKLNNSTDTEKIQTEITKLEQYFFEQNTILDSLNSQTDFSTWSKNFNKKFVEIQKTIYMALVINHNNRSLQILSQLQSIADELMANPKTDEESRKWLYALPVKYDMVTSSLNKSLEATNQKQNTLRFTNFYSKSKSEINHANSYLQEISTTLKAIVIKYSTK